jgi:ABC-type polysaccharide/polyol phosphate export permease
VPGEWLGLLGTMSEADIRARYGRGPYRLLKWLLDPVALVGVYLLLVTFVLNRPGRAPGLSLACAVVPFQLVMSTVINATGAITARRSIILNVAFNRTLLPVATVLTETVALVASLSLFGVLMAVYGVGPTTSTFWLVAAIAATILLALGFAYPATLFGVWFKDLRNFAISFVRTLFFLAPSLVPLSQTSVGASRWLRLNPFTGLFEAYRDALVAGTSPSAWELVYPAAFGLGMLLLFVPLYSREQRQLAKVVE